MKFPKVAATVRKVLKDQARYNGTTTNKGATCLAVNMIHRPGQSLMDDLRFVGIGTAELLMMFSDIVSGEVRRQLKLPLTPHDEEFVFQPGLPPACQAQLRKARIPQWFAIEEGADAMWIHFKSVTENHVAQSFLLKERKAVQTQISAGEMRNLLLIMQAFGLKSLGQAFK